MNERAGLALMGWAGASVLLVGVTVVGCKAAETDPSIRHEAGVSVKLEGDDRDYGNRRACRQALEDRLDEMLRDPEQAKGTGATMPVECHGIPQHEREIMGQEIIQSLIDSGRKSELDDVFGHDVGNESWVW